MTKSEAKAIEQRMGRAARILNGTCEADKLDWGMLHKIPGAADMVNNAIKAARDECEAVLEMATAELGHKR